MNFHSFSIILVTKNYRFYQIFEWKQWLDLDTSQWSLPACDVVGAIDCHLSLYLHINCHVWKIPWWFVCKYARNLKRIKKGIIFFSRSSLFLSTTVIFLFWRGKIISLYLIWVTNIYGTIRFVKRVETIDWYDWWCTPRLCVFVGVAVLFGTHPK